MESRRTHAEFPREIIDSQWLVEILADYLDSASHPMSVYKQVRPSVAMSEFSTPDELSQFARDTVRAMSTLGLAEAATPLRALEALAFTTGSEWLGELGAAVRQIEATKSLPIQIRERLHRIMAAVHEVWPSM